MSQSFVEAINKTIRRWTLRTNKFLVNQMEPQTLVLIGLLTLLGIQFVIYLALSSTTIYCRLPNMRAEHLSCSRSYSGTASYEKLPTIYAITPTYDRHVQKAELTRLSHTFMLVPNLHWIIVEDSERHTPFLSKFVQRIKDEFEFHTVTHLHRRTPPEYRLRPNEPSWSKPKGVWQRNRALEWLRTNMVDLDRDGVIYFADDDNTYDLEVFNEMRYTRKVSVWPVGLAGGLLVERPLVLASNGGNKHRVSSFNSMWQPKRPFPVDMAGFAISMHIFLGNQRVHFSANRSIGYLESYFLSQLVESWDDLEPRANGCTKVLVWHTRTQTPALHEELKLNQPSDSDMDL